MNKSFRNHWFGGNSGRRSIRLKGYDYSQSGLYFITICCQDRICRFGHTENGQMVLNEFGKIAFNEWLKTIDLRSNVELYDFVIMPNHIHGIVRLLDRGELNSPQIKGESISPQRENESISPQRENESISPQRENERVSGFRSPSQTIGAIVRGYKSSVTRQLGLIGFNYKLWQRNYYEHIIRNEKAFEIISRYIKNNPAKWDEDSFNNPINH